MSIGISAQVSLYPLGQDDLGSAIEGFGERWTTEVWSKSEVR